MHLRVGANGRPSRPPAQLVGRLRMFVVDEVIPAGAPVPINRVAELLRVDGSTALTVLMELGRDGFLEKVDDDTVRVRSLAEQAGDEVIQIRRLLEPPAAREAARHAREVDLITLHDLVDAVDAAVAARDYVAFRRAEEAFAATLLGLHPNAELGRLCTELRLRTAYDGLRAPVEHGVLSQVLRQHRHLLSLIEAGDLDGVEQLVLAQMDTLHLVGAPRMDTPHLASRPIALDVEIDDEFLEVAADA